MQLKKQNTIFFDLGCCAGKFCAAAAICGYKSVGIEIDEKKWEIACGTLAICRKK